MTTRSDSPLSRDRGSIRERVITRSQREKPHTKSEIRFANEIGSGIVTRTDIVLNRILIRLRNQKNCEANTLKIQALEEIQQLLKDHPDQASTLEKLCKIRVTVKDSELNFLQVLNIHRDEKPKTKWTKSLREFMKIFHLEEHLGKQGLLDILNEPQAIELKPYQK